MGMLATLTTFETDIDKLDSEIRLAQSHPDTTIGNLQEMIRQRSEIDERAMKYIGDTTKLFDKGPVSMVKIVKRMLEASQESAYVGP